MRKRSRMRLPHPGPDLLQLSVTALVAVFRLTSPQFFNAKHLNTDISVFTKAFIDHPTV